MGTVQAAPPSLRRIDSGRTMSKRGTPHGNIQRFSTDSAGQGKGWSTEARLCTQDQGLSTSWEHSALCFTIGGVVETDSQRRARREPA